MSDGERSAVITPFSRAGFWGGVGAALILYSLTRSLQLPQAQCLTAAVAGLCAVWWVLQPVPIPVTSIVPFTALPLLGIIDHKQAAHSFGSPIVVLLMAGFMLSTAMEACGAHRRLALGMARLVSGSGDVSPRRLLLGFMIAAAVASMWISNTATTLILLPIVVASAAGDENAGLRKRLLVGVAYAASIGGIGTPIGTPPNLLFLSAYRDLGLVEWSFFQWMTIGVPVVALMLPVAFFKLSAGIGDQKLGALERLKPATEREKRVLWIFALTALAWITRRFGAPDTGWSAWIGGDAVSDATVAFVGLLALLLIPDGRGGRLLNWQEAEKIPWGILLLFGGGIALAAGFKESGLSVTLGRALSGLSQAPEVILIFTICIAVTFLTEVTSNTATTALLMPILGAAATAAQIPPEKLMIPAAMSASCAFMLPVATAPNAIIFGSGQVPMSFMVKQGVVLNVLGAFVITAICVTLL